MAPSRGVNGPAGAWDLLGLAAAADARPPSVGKAERSLAGRDVRTHFATGKTGSSTLRRSLAALLADDLELEACPRNTSEPGYFANFGLEVGGDARLTAWMVEHLRVAVCPAEAGVVLDEVETAVLECLLPPLNIDKVRTPWRQQVRSGRQRMAAEARLWTPA